MLIIWVRSFFIYFKHLCVLNVHDICSFFLFSFFPPKIAFKKKQNTKGINEVIARSLDHIDPLGKNHLHISFDVDSLDPMIIPSTGTPVMGGLTFRETLQIGEYINNTGRMIAMDLVEFNPNIGTEQMINQSAKTIIEIIMAFFGKSRLG